MAIENTTKKYLSLDRLKEYDDLIKAEITSSVSDKADSNHTHVVSDITDIQTTLDTLLDNSKSYTNDAVATKAEIGHNHIIADVEGLQNELSGLQNALNEKSDISHVHDDMYYTESEIDSKVSEINASISGIIDGDTIVGKATHALTADSATAASTAEKAVQDDNGNAIVSTYETKNDATSKLNEAKGYADSIKDDLLNNAGDAYDTLKELGDLIDSNHDAIDALEIIAAGKAPIAHASSTTDYGVGNAIDYGHLKLSDSTNTTSGVNDGVAATPTAIKAVYELANTAKTNAATAQTRADEAYSLAETMQVKITGTAGQFVVIGTDGNVTTKTVPYAEEATFGV